jgi:hypothetical protein
MRLLRIALLRLALGVLWALAVGCVVVAVIDGPARGISAPREAGIRALAGLGALVAIGGIWLTARQLHKARNGVDRSLGRPPEKPAQLPDDQVPGLLKDVALKYSEPSLKLLREILLEPQKYFSRAVEDVAIDGQNLRLRGSITLVVPTDARQEIAASCAETAASREPMVIVPVMMLKKGKMIDNFEVRDWAEAAISPLSQAETQGLLVWILHDLFRAAHVSSGTLTRPLLPHQLMAQFKLTRLVRRLGRSLGVDEPGAVQETLDWLDRQLEEEKLQVFNKNVAEVLRRFSRFFANHYLIAVEMPLPTGNRLTVTYSNTLPLYAQTKTARDRLRVRVGLAAYRFEIPLGLPYIASSYHFCMAGVPEQYVADHYFSTQERYLKQSDFAADTSRGLPNPYLRLRHRSGLPYAHFYSRDLHRARKMDLVTVVEFEEVPPGALGGTATVALATAILMSLFAYFRPGLDAPQPDSELSALMLALPAFAASWLGMSADGNSLLRSSLTARLGLAAAGTMSFAGAALYLAQANHHLRFPINNLSGFAGFWTIPAQDVLWLVLAALSLALCGYLWFRLCCVTRAYMSAISKWNKIDSPYAIEL